MLSLALDQLLSNSAATKV